MDRIAAIGLLHGTGRIFHGRVIVYERIAFEGRQTLDLGVERIDTRPGISELLAPGQDFGGQDCREHGFDAMAGGKFRHRDDIAIDILQLDEAVVAGDVIDSRQDDHILRMQFQHIVAEADQHLGRRLSADAPSEEMVLPEPVGVQFGPVVRDGIAHEDSSGGDGDAFIRARVTGIFRPVFIEFLVLGGQTEGAQNE